MIRHKNTFLKYRAQGKTAVHNLIEMFNASVNSNYTNHDFNVYIMYV